MSDAAVITVEVDADLRAEFLAAAEATRSPAAQVMRELMRGFVARERQSREHVTFLERKVAAARASLDAGGGRDDEAASAEWTARRGSVSLHL